MKKSRVLAAAVAASLLGGAGVTLADKAPTPPPAQTVSIFDPFTLQREVSNLSGSALLAKFAALRAQIQAPPVVTPPVVTPVQLGHIDKDPVDADDDNGIGNGAGNGR